MSCLYIPQDTSPPETVVGNHFASTIVQYQAHLYIVSYKQCNVEDQQGTRVLPKLTGIL